jgi:hypothetical protein
MYTSIEMIKILDVEQGQSDLEEERSTYMLPVTVADI